MKRSILIAVAAVLLAAVPAMADPYGTVYVTETGVSPQTTMTVYAPGFGGGIGAYTGVYRWDLDTAVIGSNPFGMTGIGDIRTWGFCIEMQYSGGRNQYTLMDLQNTPVNLGPPDNGVHMPMGATKADYIRELWAAHIAGVTTDNTKAAAFQVAVWEIVYEDAQAWDVDGWNNGDLNNVSSFMVAGDANVINTAQGWLNGLTGSGPRNNNLVGLSRADQQDYVVEIPAPAAILLGMIGLGLVGWLKRRVA